MEWMVQNPALVQAMLSGVTALVWIVYLHLIMTGLRRQRRTAILINLGGGSGGDARFLVSNLGLEPVYLLEVLVTMRRDGQVTVAPITERAELWTRRLDRPTEATTQGPLTSGDFRDIGSVADLVERAQLHFGDAIRLDDLDNVEVTVVAYTASTSRLAAATRAFVVRTDDSGRCRVLPDSLHARQIRSFLERARLRKVLQAHFDQRVNTSVSDRDGDA